MRRVRPPLVRFMTRVDMSGGPDACWPWTGSRNHDGYGVFQDSGSHRIGAHRWMLGHKLGRPVEGMTRHSCDNPPCVNPRHLLEGTAADNGLDARLRGRTLKGQTYTKAHRDNISLNVASRKLTDAQVFEIRAELERGHSQTDIGRRYGVTQSTVSMIKYAKNHKRILAA